MNKENYDKDLSTIKAWIRGQIAKNIWGNEGLYRVIVAIDNQFQKAVTLFPEAEKIAGLH